MTLLNESKQNQVSTSRSSSLINALASTVALRKIVAVLMLSLTLPFAASAADYTWQGGSNATNAYGVYGAPGTPAVTNIPGAREGAATWRTSDGNLYMFGGFGMGETTGEGSLNDLWYYDDQNKRWTWLGGSKAVNQAGTYGTLNQFHPSLVPGARTEAAAWSHDGNLYLFGGQGYDETGNYGKLNDLWVYNIATKQWAWISGKKTRDDAGEYGPVSGLQNIPSARFGSTVWETESAEVFLLGGEGIGNSSTTGLLNDFWRYNITQNQWVWISGSNIVNSQGNYGSFNVAAQSNIPGSRKNGVAWRLADGQLALFGGEGFTDNSDGFLNDLWKFHPSTNLWTWFGGQKTINNAGIYGTLGTPSDNNIPGARRGAAYLTDPLGNLWLFGGYGYGASGVGLGYLNDLWVFDAIVKQWYWAGGGLAVNPTGIYGFMGVTSASSVAGGREKAALWLADAENLILMGGNGFAASAPSGKLNDVWKINTPGFDLGVTVQFDKPTVGVREFVNANIVVTNHGSATSGISDLIINLPWDVFLGNAISISPTGAGTVEEYFYESHVKLQPLSPGASVTVTVPIYALVKGALSVTAISDALGDVSATNNSAMKTVEVTSDAPSDLVGGANIVKSKLKQKKKGSTTQVKLQAWMTGTVSADFPKTVSKIYLQDTTILPPTGELLTTTKWSKIKSKKPWKPLKVLKKNVNVKIPGVAEGKYLILHLDADLGAREVNEHNNYIVIGPIHL